MAAPSIFQQILDPANRANPYPLFAELRKTPVLREHDGTWVVSTYDTIAAVLHDPRVSSDLRPGPRLAQASASGLRRGGTLPDAFIRRDPPEHDRLRRIATRPFGPPHAPGFVDALRPWLAERAAALIDTFAGETRVDLVDAFAFPFPVEVVCRLLGVPAADAPRFHGWANDIVSSLDPGTGTTEERDARADRVRAEVADYLDDLVDPRVREPGDDLLSGMLHAGGPDGPMPREHVLATGVLLLVAGHETTVNLIANGVVTLLRHPHVLERLRRESGLIVPLVEELLRYEPPVQLLPERVTLDDIEIAGATIPKGSTLLLAIAAGNRDPDRFPDPERFIPDRFPNPHLGFGSGIHYCFGAPLARLEAQIALTELVGRLDNPRLAEDPPPYRANAALRGPCHVVVEFDGVRPARSSGGAP